MDVLRQQLAEAKRNSWRAVEAARAELAAAKEALENQAELEALNSR